MSVQLVFDYLVPKIGNGLQTRVPNLKNDNLILQQIEFESNDKDRPELEVTLKHGGNTLQYSVSYFQIFDRINLSNYWYRLADGDDLELGIRNKSNKQQNLKVTFTYAESAGIIIHNSSLRAGDFKELPILTDLTNGWIPQKFYLKSNTLIKGFRLIPKFKLKNDTETDSELSVEPSSNLDSQSDSDIYQQTELNQNEVLIDFSEEELAALLPMLGYYQLEVDFADPDQIVHLLAFGFKR